MKIGWICLSGIGPSESFLVDTLHQLENIGQVIGVSGVSTGARAASANHRYIPFNEHPLTVWHTLGRKLTGRNKYREQLQARCLKMSRDVWAENEPDVFWVEFGTTAVVAKDLLKEQNKPFFIAVHGYDITTEFKDEEYQAQFIDLANHHQCQGIVCASHYTRRLCILAGVQAEKCKVVRLALDGERIKRDVNIKKTQQPSFVHFGRLTEKKHPIATFEAFRQVAQSLPNASLTFIGEGPLRSELERRIAESGLGEQVQCSGVMEQAKALAEVQRHWVFVQHSVTSKSGDQEGFALSPAEAALMEMPVVSTMHNGIPEHVIDGKTGYLVNEFDYETMADRMIELASNSDLRTEMGDAGRANVLVLCDPESRLQALRELLG